MVGTRVYVGGLSYRVTERDIDKFFKGFAGVGDIVIKNGFAFVEFEDIREAEDAIYEMNGKELLGGRVTVEKAKGTPRTSRWPRGGSGMGGGRMMRRQPQRARFDVPSRTSYRLTVTNLSSQVSWQDLKDFMRQGGEVTYADAHKQRKNEGVIEFATHSDMRNALNKLDGKDLGGRRIRLYKESNQGEGSRGARSRSRSPYSRSKSRSASRSRSRSFTPKRGKSRSRSHSSSRSRGSRRSVSRSHSPERHENDNNDRSRSNTLTPQNERNMQEYD